jgi:Rrf2 family protein
MRITAEEEYGLRCLLRVGQLERERAGQPIGIREVAENEGLSAPYVAKLLAKLRQAGLVQSIWGRQGGYKLARPAGEIRLGALLLALGEPLYDDPGYCTRYAGTETDGCCVHLDTCSLRTLWHTLERWMRQTLDQLTLADLLSEERQIVDVLRRRLAEATPGAPPLINLPVLSDEPADKPRKKTANAK